jgi:hypothetical protein
MNVRKIIRSTAFVVWLYSLLMWGYISARIIFSRVDMSTPFIDGINVSFWVLGIYVFIISAIALWVYLILREDKSVKIFQHSPP